MTINIFLSGWKTNTTNMSKFRTTLSNPSFLVSTLKYKGSLTGNEHSHRYSGQMGTPGVSICHPGASS